MIAAAVETGLAGKAVLVTGASGVIGAACARAFAAEGARVLVHYHRGRERADRLARELGDAVAVGADLTDEEDAEALFAEARRAIGPLDVCVAVAGASDPEDTPVQRLSLERWNAMLSSNLTATFLTARGFLREVERNGHGNLVLVGSTAALFGQAGNAAYAAAKSAVVFGLLLSLKNEIVRIGPRSRVNAICPGWTDTPMTHERLADQAFLEEITRTMALRKAALPEDTARQAVALASDEISGHVTGQIVAVAGGMEGRIIHS